MVIIMVIIMVLKPLAQPYFDPDVFRFREILSRLHVILQLP
jgi:hypothetical protein